MANKTLKKVAFWSMLALMMGSCKSGSDENNSKKPAVAQQKIVKVEKTNTEQAMKDFYVHVADSIRNVNGHYKYMDSLQNGRNKYADESDMMDIHYKYSLGGVMTNEALTSGYQIIDKTFKEIAFELSKYKIVLKNHIGQKDNKSCFYLIADSSKVCHKSNMCAGGVFGDDEYLVNDEWDIFQNMINTVIDSSECNQKPKDYLKAQIACIINNTKKDLVANRQSIEQKYSDFYVLCDADRKNLGWCSDGFGYKSLNNQGKYLVTKRHIDVYDFKLSPDFFGEAGAEYKLISLGDHKWQVIKKTASGQIQKTAVFLSKADYKLQYIYSNRKPADADEFSFKPGKNGGVHISYVEKSDVKRRAKDWNMHIPKDAQHKIDSLTNELQRKENLENLAIKTYIQADSIANIMVKDRFGQNIK